MHSVLIVDDEPLILSGVKHLIDWEEEGCFVAGTASDGKSADLFIASHLPDIVICDINMPGMNGIELLKKASSLYPDTVFIMLTCLEEFTLAKEAMRYGAVDYVLKTELDGPELRKSLRRAKAESDARRKLKQGNTKSEVRRNDEEETRDAMLSRLYLAEPLDQSQVAYYRSRHMDRNIVLLQVLLTMVRTEEDPFDSVSFKEKTSYAIDIVTRIVSASFPSFHIVSRSSRRFFTIFFYLHNVVPSTYPSSFERCAAKIKTSLNDLVGVDGNVVATDVCPDITRIEEAKSQLTAMKDLFFILGKTLTAKETGSVTFSSASLETVSGRVLEAIHLRQNENFSYYLGMFKTRLQKENFPQSEVIWRCEEIVSGALHETEDPKLKELKTSLSYISTLRMAFLWLDRFKATVQEVWSGRAETKLTIADKAKMFIDTNVHSRIYLSDVAEAVHVSSGYLSSVFTKQCGMSVVEYINKMKTEEAMRLIRKRPCKIIELAQTLGYENSYYFSKVFRKYAHMSPTDYQEENQKND